MLRGSVMRLANHEDWTGDHQIGIALRDRPGSRGAESCNVPALPGRLDRTSGVALTDEGHRLTGGHTVQYGKTGKGGARPAVPAAAGDLYSLVLGSAPCLAQRVSRVVLVLSLIHIS